MKGSTIFRLLKGGAVTTEQTANLPPATPEPTRCRCGEPSSVARVEIEAFKLKELFEFGVCDGCVESFRCWLTSRKLVYHEQHAA